MRIRVYGLLSSVHRNNIIVFLTRNIVTVGLNASGEVGVLRDGWAVVIQRWKLCRDICMSWH